MEKWLNFYRPFFPTEKEVRSFVEACEQLVPPNTAAKIMMHQTQRLVSLSDDIATIRPHREALRTLFLIMCAENISKLHDNFLEEGQSRAHVRKFFDEFLDADDQRFLAEGFVDCSKPLMPQLGLRAAVDMLYDVRCDVVHEGKYWQFTFHNGHTPMLNPNHVISHITFDEFRAILVRGCLNAVQTRLP